MIQLQLLLAVVSCLLFHLVSNKSCTPCGTSKHFKDLKKVDGEEGERIIGGWESPPHAFPWVVRLRGGCAGKSSSFRFKTSKNV